VKKTHLSDTQLMKMKIICMNTGDICW